MSIEDLDTQAVEAEDVQLASVQARACPRKQLIRALHFIATNQVKAPGQGIARLEDLPSVECDVACPGPQEVPLSIGSFTLPLLTVQTCPMQEK